MKTGDWSDGLFIGEKFFKMQKIVTSWLIESGISAFFICTDEPQPASCAGQPIGSVDFLPGCIACSLISNTSGWGIAISHERHGINVQEHVQKKNDLFGQGDCIRFASDQSRLISDLFLIFCRVDPTISALIIPIEPANRIIEIRKNARSTGYDCKNAVLQNSPSPRLAYGEKTCRRQ